MYQFLISKFGKNAARILIVIWYVFLLFLVIIFYNIEPGRFKYLEW